MRYVAAIGVAFGLLAVVALHISAKRTYACSAPAPPPLIEVIEGFDFAFVGEVVSIDRQEIKGEKYRTFEEIIEFKTSVVWKGDPYGTMFVRTIWYLTPTPDSNCLPEPRFGKGGRYIVFVLNGRTRLSRGGPTQNFYDAPEDQIATLGVGKAPRPGSASPIPEREGQPVERWSRGGCGLTPGYALGSINLAAIGLTVMLAWFWLRQRFRR